MADKRISQLIERTDIANNDVLPIVASGATTTNKVTVSTLQDWMQDNLDVGVTSVGLSVPSAFTVSGSPVTTSGNITISGAGTTAQYIRGDGSLADFPSSLGGGGASVSYYLNGSVSQGTIGGVAYREMNKTPILGTGTDFVAIADGYLASFITDAGDPSLLEIPAGNWNFETYFSASSGGGSPSFYIELYKVSSGGTATLIASNSAVPELIAFGTTITAYFSALAVPTTTLALTDRLALRYYVARSGRTITLHTENSHLSQIITTFTTGLTALNGLTAQVQNFATGTSGTDFNISSASTTHTFNLPDASASNRGVVTTGTQTIAGIKTFTSTIRADVSVLLAQAGTALPTDLRNISGTGLTSSGSNGFGFNSGNNIYFSGSDKGGGIISFSNTGNQTYTLQNASGTLAFTSDLGGYLPLTGGTLTGALGGTSLNFSGDIQTATRLISATGGQQILINANNGGSSNRIESVGTLPLALVSAAAITMAAGGTTPQITLATTGAVTLTGALNGTSASFSGGITLTGGVYKITGSSIGSASERWLGTDGGGGWFLNRPTGTDITFGINNANNFNISSNGAATFSSSVTATGGVTIERASATASNPVRWSTGGTLDWYLGSSPLGNSTSDLSLYSYGTSSVVFHVAKASGNVGIGTASPQTTLSIETSGVQSTISPIITSQSSGTTYTGIYSIRDGAGDQRGLIFQNYTANVGLTEKMRITSSGAVGIGVTSPNTQLHVAGSHTINDVLYLQRSSSSLFLPVMNYWNGSGQPLNGTKGDIVAIGNAGGDGVVIANANTEIMRINSTGVGIGTASPSELLDIRGANRDQSSGQFNQVIYSTSSQDELRGGSIGFGGFYTGTSLSTTFGAIKGFKENGFGDNTAGVLAFYTRPNGGAMTERMRITSGGDVLVNSTSVTYGEKFKVAHSGASANTALFYFTNTNDRANIISRHDGSLGSNNREHIVFINGNGVGVGNIVANGSATAYNTSSDYRLKEDLQEIKGLEKVSALKVYDFKWKDSEDRMDGVLAHELAEVLPYAVNGEKDAVDEQGNDKNQGVDYSKIVPVLIKAIQELKAEIDSLKTK
jgi:hypothetical protein